MRALQVVVLSLSVVVLSAGVAPSPASAEDCSRSRCAPPAISSKEVTARLNDLLMSEGLGPTRTGVPVVQGIELDGDPMTVEALVTVVSPEHCIAAACASIIVKRDCTGAVVSIGHGTWVTPLVSTTNGWLDLASAALGLIPARALKYSDGRYS